jgi:outer membrane protein assembly factor BamB
VPVPTTATIWLFATEGESAALIVASTIAAADERTFAFRDAGSFLALAQEPLVTRWEYRAAQDEKSQSRFCVT